MPIGKKKIITTLKMKKISATLPIQYKFHSSHGKI
jgi:hypothetical protein